MKLRIALDLDNTIIDYGALFRAVAIELGFFGEDAPADKEQLREALVARDGSDLRWQKLQAEAYGPRILGAAIFPGARELVEGARARGHELFVLSHKTARSNFDPSVDLRAAAMRWLEASGLLGARGVERDHVRFFDDRAAKVRAVGELGCAWLVDDLRAVLEDPGLAPGVTRVWFTQGRDRPSANGLVACAHWHQIDALLRGVEALGEPLAACEPVASAGGNARVLHLRVRSGAERVLKLYPRDGRRRLLRERDALGWMKERGIACVPELLFTDVELSCAVLTRVDGERAGGKLSDADLARACADFVLRLAALGRGTPPERFGPASEARLSLADHRAALGRRLATLDRVAETNDRARALAARLRPLVERALVRHRDLVRAAGLDPTAELAADERIPSPSDLGPHNLLAGPKGIFFVDFEYFGWDDPVKLMADFRHSVAHDLAPAAREQFIAALLQGLDTDGRAARRLAVVDELIALEWVLIVLGALDPDKRPTPATIDARIERADRMLSALEARA